MRGEKFEAMLQAGALWKVHAARRAGEQSMNPRCWKQPGHIRKTHLHVALGSSSRWTSAVSGAGLQPGKFVDCVWFVFNHGLSPFFCLVQPFSILCILIWSLCVFARWAMNDGPSCFLRTIPGELDAKTNLNVWTEKSWTRRKTVSFLVSSLKLPYTGQKYGWENSTVNPSFLRRLHWS